MNTLAINNQEITIKEYMGQRVVTFKEIDGAHQRPEGTARKRFNDNKKYFVEGVDYFVRKTDEAYKEYGISAPNGLYLITETGYLMLVKSFTDSLAWAVQRELVNNYFRVTVRSSRADDVAKMRNKLIALDELLSVYGKRYKLNVLECVRNSIISVTTELIAIATYSNPSN